MNKRILIFSTAYFPFVGGAEIAVKEITDRLPDWQFDLICARIQLGLTDTERIGNVTVHRCGIGHSVDKYLLPILGVWRAVMLMSRVPVVWSILSSYGGFTALVYTLFRPKTKLLLTLQEGDPLEHYTERTGWLTGLHKRIFVRADAVQVISAFLGDWARRMGFNGTPEVIPNGVDVARFAQRLSTERRQQLRESWGVTTEDVVLVTASRLSLKNGVDDLIRSLVHLPANVKAVIAGEGEDREMLKALATQLGVPGRVIFLGARSHDELPGILQASDIFVRASLTEALGNSFLEAMAAGVPIIGTPVGGIPDFLTDGETGVFCQPRDPASIARAVRRIQTEQGLREKISRQAMLLVRDRYDWSTIVERMNALLTRLYASSV